MCVTYVEYIEREWEKRKMCVTYVEYIKRERENQIIFFISLKTNIKMFVTMEKIWHLLPYLNDHS
jgi:hypothetical protein